MYLLHDQLVPKDQASISPLDRGFLFGDGIYEVFRVYHRQWFEKDAHLRRLKRSLDELKLTLPYSLEKLDDLLQQLVQAEEIQTGIVYVQVTRGTAPRTHAFPAEAAPTVFGYAQEYPRPVELMEQGIQATLTEDIRWHRVDIKTLNLLPNTLAKQQALENGFDEAIFHRDGIVTECTASNIMLVKNGTLRTHPANQWILHGVSRATVLQMADKLGIPVVEEPFSIHELFEADELLLTGTTVEVTPIIRVDDRTIGSGKRGPIAQQLQAEFDHRITQL